jgi:class 3 adenylate cyclase
LLGDLADVILLGTPQLKGKALPVNVYELRSLRGEGLHQKPLTVELGQEVSAQ